MKRLLSFTISTLYLLAKPTTILAGTVGGGSVRIPGNPLSPQNYTSAVVTQTFDSLVSVIIGFLTVIAAIYFMFQIFFAGYGIITAGGDPGKLAENRQRITNSVLGLATAVAAYAITGLIANLLGIDVFNPLSFL